jgi:hypothetical protein
MQHHVKTLAILHIVLGCLGLIAAVFILVLFGGIAAMIGMEGAGDDAAVAVPIVGGIGLFISAFAALLSIPGIIAGVGLLSFKPWARVLTLVVSALHLINIPIGTAIGFYGFWVLMSREGTMLFERPAVSYTAPRG